MMRILSAAMLLTLGFTALCTSFYLPTLDIPRALYNALPFYAPLASFFLTAALAVKTQKGKRPWIVSVLVFIIAATACEFALREFALPLAFVKPPANPLPEEFLRGGHPDSKKGIMASTPQGIYIFGEILKTPAAYIGRNFSLLTSNAVQESDMVRIEDNRILALNLRTTANGRTTVAQGASILQIPLAIAPLYSLWGVKNPQNTVLTEVTGRFEIFKNPLFEPYKKTVVLAFARYAGTFLLLLVSAAFALSAANTLDCKNMHILGTLSAALFGLPAICMVHYYIIEIINAAVNGLL